MGATGALGLRKRRGTTVRTAAPIALAPSCVLRVVAFASCTRAGGMVYRTVGVGSSAAAASSLGWLCGAGPWRPGQQRGTAAAPSWDRPKQKKQGRRVAAPSRSGSTRSRPLFESGRRPPWHVKETEPEGKQGCTDSLGWHPHDPVRGKGDAQQKSLNRRYERCGGAKEQPRGRSTVAAARTARVKRIVTCAVRKKTNNPRKNESCAEPWRPSAACRDQHGLFGCCGSCG